MGDLRRRFAWLLVIAAACGHADVNVDQGIGTDAGLGDMLGDDGLDVQPSALQTITVQRGQNMPPVAYTATLHGVPVSVAWSVDRGDVGAMPAAPAASAPFTPTGVTGGMVEVRARMGTITITRQVFVKLTAGTQNGADPGNAAEQKQIATDVPSLSTGGGIGGVGGEGLGGPVTDPVTTMQLASPTGGSGAAQSLQLVYPYDGTVWPRGMLAPLLMWSWSQGDADAISIELSTTSGSFAWKGTFAKPAVLSQPGTPSGGTFMRHPIPQDIWTTATNTAGGTTPDGKADQLTVKLVVAHNGQGFGPIAQTWTIAPARLSGTVYYNSYGTRFVKNWGGQTDTAGHPIGAAVLGIRSGDASPHLVAGTDSPVDINGIPTDNSGCRVCHVVASRGRYLITQANIDDDVHSYLYDLNATDVQASALLLPPDGTHAWSGLTSDGSYGLTNSVDPANGANSITNAPAGTATSAFYAYGTPAGSGVAAQSLAGLPSGVAAAYPSYSPDDKFITYTDATGHTGNVQGPIVAASYDGMTHAFSNLHTLVTPTTGHRVGFPAYLPDNSAIIYEDEVRSSSTDTVMVTRNGARGTINWVNANGTPMPVSLSQLNGVHANASYLPTGGNQHGLGNTDAETSYDDTTLAYEPTVLPIVAGHYAWVVFTSRRLYGNELTTNPWASDPRSGDITNLAQSTTKKLWVAAIDLNAPAGSDPSHPAFYLPAQEITAGNSRGFWTLDPCRSDGASCESGDQCCNGFCEPDPTTHALVCSDTATCAAVQEKCKTAADCCDTTNLCTNGFCAASPIL